ncbi:hypothetical protein PR048_016215 [Dryococelus australis]|uniref:Uncharacterized protein n=1 Tax=Dryococelus australis TaxID=614101 RepID=A0ABQ9HJ50_9NEOP|nr:hypothetical protein PR048_016215 [Dryococelus australis]
MKDVFNELGGSCFKEAYKINYHRGLKLERLQPKMKACRPRPQRSLTNRNFNSKVLDSCWWVGVNRGPSARQAKELPITPRRQRDICPYMFNGVDTGRRSMSSQLFWNIPNESFYMKIIGSRDLDVKSRPNIFSSLHEDQRYDIVPHIINILKVSSRSGRKLSKKDAAFECYMRTRSTPMQSHARSGDVPLDARASVALIASALLGLRRGNIPRDTRLRAKDDLLEIFPYIIALIHSAESPDSVTWSSLHKSIGYRVGDVEQRQHPARRTGSMIGRPEATGEPCWVRPRHSAAIRLRAEANGEAEKKKKNVGRSGVRRSPRPRFRADDPSSTWPMLPTQTIERGLNVSSTARSLKTMQVAQGRGTGEGMGHGLCWGHIFGKLWKAEIRMARPGIEPGSKTNANPVLRAGEGEAKGEYGSAPECKCGVTEDPPEETRRPAVSPGTIPKCQDLGATLPESSPIRIRKLATLNCSSQHTAERNEAGRASLQTSCEAPRAGLAHIYEDVVSYLNSLYLGTPLVEDHDEHNNLRVTVIGVVSEVTGREVTRPRRHVTKEGKVTDGLLPDPERLRPGATCGSHACATAPHDTLDSHITCPRPHSSCPGLGDKRASPVGEGGAVTQERLAAVSYSRASQNRGNQEANASFQEEGRDEVSYLPHCRTASRRQLQRGSATFSGYYDSQRAHHNTSQQFVAARSFVSCQSDSLRRVITDRERETQRNTERETQRDREAERERDKERHRKKDTERQREKQRDRERHRKRDTERQSERKILNVEIEISGNRNEIKPLSSQSNKLDNWHRTMYAFPCIDDLENLRILLQTATFARFLLFSKGCLYRPPNEYHLESDDDHDHLEVVGGERSCSRDPEFSVDLSSVDPHKITHNELSYLTRDSYLSKVPRSKFFSAFNDRKFDDVVQGDEKTAWISFKDEEGETRREWGSAGMQGSSGVQAGETEIRGNRSLTSIIVWHDSHVRNFGTTQRGIMPGSPWRKVGSPTTSPQPVIQGHGVKVMDIGFRYGRCVIYTKMVVAYQDGGRLPRWLNEYGLLRSYSPDPWVTVPRLLSDHGSLIPFAGVSNPSRLLSDKWEFCKEKGKFFKGKGTFLEYFGQFRGKKWEKMADGEEQDGGGRRAWLRSPIPLAPNRHNHSDVLIMGMRQRKTGDAREKDRGRAKDTGSERKREEYRGKDR